MARLKNQVNGSNRIEAADVQVMGPTLDPRYTDDGAVSLVIQDAERARTFIDQKQWNLYWRESDVLYQSPRTNQAFEGSTVAPNHGARENRALWRADGRVPLRADSRARP